MTRRHGLPGPRAISFLLTFAAAATAQATAPLVKFDIPAGDAMKTLQEFAAQSNIEMLYSQIDLTGVTTHPISGDLDVREALARMLEGTRLTVKFDRDSFASIRRSLIDVDSPSGDAEQTPQALADEEKLKEIVVTGSYIRGVQDIISPAIREQDLPEKGTTYATVQEALQSVPLVSRGGPSELFDPGGNFGGNFGRGASVDLRGLGPSATLVLVNGRRQAPSGANAAFVDVSNIPWSAVKQIDILPDGASALYGSDAIAGVVNILMRDDLKGAETQMHISANGGHGGETLIAQLFGTRWSSGKLFFSYQFQDRDALPADARRYTASSDKTPLGGSNFASNRSNPGNLLNPFTGQPAYAIPPGQDGSSLTPADLEPGSTNLQNRLADVDLWPDMRMHSAYVSAEQSLGRRFAAFAEGRFSQRTISQRYYAADALLLVPSSNPHFIDAFGTPFTLVAYSFDKDFGPIVTDGRTRTYAGALGVSAKLSDSWTASLTRSYAAEDLRWIARNQVNFTALNQALADPDPSTAFNPFGDGSHTPAQTLASIRVADAEQTLSRIVTKSLAADGPLVSLSSGTARLAIGVEDRTETLDRGPVPAMTYGREVRSVFAELAIPLVGEPSDPRATPHVQLSLAGRTERYSDFGSAFNPKIGFEGALSDAIKLRGTWGTSFSAPHLVDLYDTSQNRSALVPVADPQVPEGRSLVLLTQGNNPALREERAKNWTAGVDLAPARVPGLAVSLTYYHIRHRDGVFHPAPPLSLEAILGEPQWSALVTREPTAQSVRAICASAGFMGLPEQCDLTPPSAIIDARPRNLSSTTVRGVDVTLSQALDTDIGRISLAFNGSYVLALDRALTDTSAAINVVNTVENPVGRRARWTAGWDQHGAKSPGFGARLSLDYSGRYRDNLSALHPAIETWLTTDLSASYRIPASSGAFDNLEVVLNVNNLFNTSPPFTDRELGYDVANARPYGRVWGFFVRKNW